jgi:cytochrome c
MEATKCFLRVAKSCLLLAGLCLSSIAVAEDAPTPSLPTADSEHAQLVSRGAEVFQRCSACHRLGANARNRIGPQLNDILGRKAGSIKGARYSPAMKQAGADGLVWNAETIGAFIADPKGFLEGTTMGLRGVEDAGDREALVAYLSSFSTGPSNIPETPVPPPAPVDAGIPADILALEGDAEYGEYLSGECVTCHQPSGADKGIPSIIGWPKEDFVIAMHAYKNQRRPHPVMRMIAGRLSAEEIAGLAAYFHKKDR